MVSIVEVWTLGHQSSALTTRPRLLAYLSIFVNHNLLKFQCKHFKSYITGQSIYKKKMEAHLVNSAVLWSDIVKIFSLRNPLNVSLPSGPILKDRGQGGLVGTLLGDADAHDAHVHGRVVFQGVPNHQSFLHYVTFTRVVSSFTFRFQKCKLVVKKLKLKLFFLLICKKTTTKKNIYSAGTYCSIKNL